MSRTLRVGPIGIDCLPFRSDNVISLKVSRVLASTGEWMMDAKQQGGRWATLEAFAIPRMADRAANDANIAAIDRLCRTQKYRHIVAWGKFLGLTPTTICSSLEQAEADNAPVDAIQKVGGAWLCLGDIVNETNRKAVGDLATPAATQRD